MTRRLHSLGLPLLARELTELAARRRTYVVRTLYACLLFGVTLLTIRGILSRRAIRPDLIFGSGAEVFAKTLSLQFLGIFVFLPALASGAIAAEKERNTLGLLFVTRLGPWTIVIEKYLSRLIPMGTFLLLSLPVLGFSYSLGGITQTQLWSGVWALFLTTLQVGAVAIACSAYCRSTVSAFVATYVVGLALYFGLVIAAAALQPLRLFLDGVARGLVLLARLLETLPFLGGAEFAATAPQVAPLHWSDVAMCLCLPNLMERPDASPAHVILFSLPVLASTAAFLGLARRWIVRRAFLPPRNLTMALFRRLDALFYRINQNRVTKGIVLIRDGGTLPEYAPVAWRETRKKSLGTARYLIRIFVALEFPVLAFCLLLVLVQGPSTGPLSALMFLVWVLAALLVTVKATTLIAGERSHQTLDVLLSTPMTCRDLIEQKFRGVKRLIGVLAVPLLTIILFQTWWSSLVAESMGRNRLGQRYGAEMSAASYFLGSVLAVLVYLPLAAYIGMYLGMRIKSQGRAILASLGVLIAWCLVPWLLFVPSQQPLTQPVGGLLLSLLLLSPASIIMFNEGMTPFGFANSHLALVCLNFAIYGMILWLVRRRCLVGAGKRLGRCEVPAAYAY